MSLGSRRAFIRTAAAIDRHLTNCEVELALTAGWASQLYEPTAPAIKFDDAENLQYHGIFSDYFEEGLDTEGHTLSVSLPAIVSKGKTQFDSRVFHGDRMAIRMLELPEHPRLVCKVRRIEPDGRHRTLYFLHALGPLCADINPTARGYGSYSFPFAFGPMTFNKCVQLDVINPKRV